MFSKNLDIYIKYSWEELQQFTSCSFRFWAGSSNKAMLDPAGLKKKSPDPCIKDDGDITVIGEIIAKLPVDVRLGKLIVLGKWCIFT